MSVVNELIKVGKNGTLCFGNYLLDQKTKRSDFEFQGDIYKVKTFKEITKLEKNEMFLYESVEGTAVSNFAITDSMVSFEVEALGDVQITLGLVPDTVYSVKVDGESIGDMKTNLSGKLVLSIELDSGQSKKVDIIPS